MRDRVVRDREFQFEKLWDVVKAIHLWCNGPRSPSDFVQARSALNIALVEVNRAIRRAGQKGGGVPSDKTQSDWAVDDQIRETLKTVARRLSTTKLISEMNGRGLTVSVSTVKKRLALMVREKRLPSL
jgi:hypothetical protein